MEHTSAVIVQSSHVLNLSDPHQIHQMPLEYVTSVV